MHVSLYTDYYVHAHVYTKSQNTQKKNHQDSKTGINNPPFSQTFSIKLVSKTKTTKSVKILLAELAFLSNFNKCA